MTDKNIHVGIKNGMFNITDHTDDGDNDVGFSRIHGEDIEELGWRVSSAIGIT
jgi:hypothetical protein